MKKIISIIAAFVAALTFQAQAQIAGSTGPREAANLQKHVNLFLGAEKKVLTGGTTVTTNLVTSGKGVLLGVEISNFTDGGVVPVPRSIKFWDANSIGSLSVDGGVTATTLGNADKIIPDQFIGPMVTGDGFQTVSDGGTFSSMTLATTVNNQYIHPVKFTKGILIQYPAVTNGSITTYWLK